MPDDPGLGAGPATGPVTGLVLAAGSGRRAGGPKALRVDEHGIAWVVRAVRVLRAGGCPDVAVVVGAAGDRVRSLLAGETVEVIDSPDWEQGMGASLAAGLTALSAGGSAAALVHLVDLPDVGPAVAARVLAVALDTRAPDGLLVRAGYAGGPGHPVLIGKDHWPGVVEAATGDRGARDYLSRHPVAVVDCSDLAGGRDRDN